MLLSVKRRKLGYHRQCGRHICANDFCSCERT